MTFAEAATLARDGGARRLWLTHFGPLLVSPAMRPLLPRIRSTHRYSLLLPSIILIGLLLGASSPSAVL